jgi:phenol hydroxylase P5 protein
VQATRVLCRDVLEVDLDLIEPSELAFEAGQWISVPFGPKTVRAYSIASTPRSPSRITLCADVSPGGIGSAWFRGLALGQAVEFKAPFGGFVLREGDARASLFVAEEIGIVPIRAMLADLDERGVAVRATLVYAGHDPTTLPYHEEFLHLAERHPGLVYRPTVTATGAPGLAARVDALVAEPRDVVVYVCGGGPMVDAVRQRLLARGADRRSVRWEKFW